MTDQTFSENHILYLLYALFLCFLVVGSVQLMDDEEQISTYDSQNITMRTNNVSINI